MKAGMSNREALPALRHARADLAPLAGQSPHQDTDPRLPSRNNGGDDHNNDGTDPERRESETNPRKPSMTSGRSTKNCHRTTLENMPR